MTGTPAQFRTDFLAMVAFHRDRGDVVYADRLAAEATFRDRFPLAIGWNADAFVHLGRGELYPTLEVQRAMQHYLTCESGAVAYCRPGELALPAGVLRPGATAGAEPIVSSGAAVAPSPAPPGAEPAPGLEPAGVPWGRVAVGVGIAVLFVVGLAVGRRMVA